MAWGKRELIPEREQTMRRSSQFAVLLGAAILISAAAPEARADTVLYESATLGPTGITAEQLTTQAVAGTNVNEFVFVGARFELAQPVVTSQIGGHFAKIDNQNPNDVFFGAIVALDGPDDLPDSGDLSTPDLLGNTLLTFPDPSDEVFGELELTLQPGWYGVVFGSGLFDAQGRGGAVRNGEDIGNSGYISFQPGGGGAWGNLSAFFSDHRFVVRGELVPEPTSIVLLLISGTCLSSCRRQVAQ